MATLTRNQDPETSWRVPSSNHTTADPALLKPIRCQLSPHGWHMLPIKIHTNPAKLIDIFMFIDNIFGINTIAVWIFWFYIWSQGITNILVHFSRTMCVYCVFLGEHDQVNDEGSVRLQWEEGDCWWWKSGLVVVCCLFFSCLLILLYCHADTTFSNRGRLLCTGAWRCVEESWQYVGYLLKGSGIGEGQLVSQTEMPWHGSVRLWLINQKE